jgi:hypothetical protein
LDKIEPRRLRTTGAQTFSGVVLGLVVVDGEIERQMVPDFGLRHVRNLGLELQQRFQREKNPQRSHASMTYSQPCKRP